MHFHILVQHRHHTNWKITRNSTTNLEESNTFSTRIFRIPISQISHVLDSRFHCREFQITFDTIRCENISHCRIFPTWNYDWQVLLSRCDHPRIFFRDFIILFKNTRQDHFVHIFVREISFSFRICIFPNFVDVFLQSSERFFFRDTSVSYPV